jgi:hypothetical protein
VKYIKDLKINNKNFNFDDLKEIKYDSILIRFNDFSRKEMIDFYNKTTSNDKELFEHRTVVNFFLAHIEKLLNRDFINDEELILILLSFKDTHKLAITDYFKLNFDVSRPVPQKIKDYLFNDHKLATIYIINLYEKYSENPQIINVLSIEDRNEIEKTIVSNKKSLEDYFFQLKTYLKEKHEFKSFSIDKLGKIIQTEHPIIYNYYVNVNNPNIYFINKLLNERVSPEIEEAFLSKSTDGANIIEYVEKYIKQRVPKFEEVLINKIKEGYTLKDYFLKIVVKFYLDKIEDKTFERLQYEFENDLKIFIDAFNRYAEDTVFKFFIDYFADVFKKFMNNEEQMNVLINKYFPKLFTKITTDQIYLYEYCKHIYKNPLPQYDRIFLNNNLVVYKNTSYVILLYLEFTVLPYYNDNVVEMLKDYQDFEDFIFNNMYNNKVLGIYYMLTIRGRWKKGEQLLINYLNSVSEDKYVSDFLNSKLLKKKVPE